MTVNACEDAAGKANVLHLAIGSGTDLILFNALMTEIAAKGWLDKAFVGQSTAGFDEMLAANKVSIDEAAQVTGLKPDDIRKAAALIAEPKQGGGRRRTMFAYEKGLIWGNDNYRTNGALVNIALAAGNVGRPGGGCVRMGGHQESRKRRSSPTSSTMAVPTTSGSKCISTSTTISSWTAGRCPSSRCTRTT